MYLQIFWCAIIGLLAILQNPGLVIRPKWILALSEKSGIHWTDFEVASKSTGLLKPEIEFRWGAVKVLRPDFHAETARADIRFSLNFLHPTHPLTKMDLLSIQGIRFSVSPSSQPAPSPSTSKASSGISIPSWIRQAQTGIIDIQVLRWSAGGDHGSAYFQHAPLASPSRARLATHDQWQWALGGSEVSHRLNADVTVLSESQSLNGPWRIVVDAEARHVSPEIRRVQTRNCVIHWDSSSSTKHSPNSKDILDVQCPLEITLRPPSIPSLPSLKFHEKAKLALTSKLESENILNMDKPLSVDAKVALSDIRASGEAASLGRIFGDLSASGKLIPSEPMKNWKTKTAFDLELNVSRFQRLVRFLDPTDYAVPAPFHALRGSLELVAKGEFESTHGKLPIRFETRLHSPNQSLVLDGEGTFLLQRLGSNLDFNLELTDVEIPLPHLDLAEPPQFVPDPRIQARSKTPPSSPAPKEHEQAGQASSLAYHVGVKTGEKPIRIQTNLAKSPVPIHLDLRMISGGVMTGTVHVDPFPLDMFRRNAQLEYFDVDITPKENKISGSFKVTYTDYTIHIQFVGTADQPDIKFLSDPPLSDSDIISVLLFGRTSEDLDQSQSQSSGNVKSAVAARGLDLAALYLLSATPVESVGWDPQSGTFSAKFRLAEGTSLSVTKGQEEMESVGIRKRIGSHWAITTQLGNPVDPTDHSIFALFEWSHRY
jgi:hypothetical protein